MKLISNPFTYTSARLIVATALVSTLALTPEMVFAIDNNVHEDSVQLRIKDMHTKLKITAAQEEQWTKVAQAMLDDAKTMDTLTQVRVDHAKDMTAIDDLKSYGEIADAHADGVKKLTPLFTDLYAGMSDTQKKEADALFRHDEQTHSRKKASSK